MSSTPDSALADPQQTIDDLQRELAERTAERDEASRRLDKRTAERDEALEQQTATAEVLQVINSSPGELAPVFGAMLEKAMQLCEAEFGILNTYDGETFHRAAARGVPPAFEEWRLRQGPMPSGPRTLYGRITSGDKNVLHTLDLMAEGSYRDGDPDRRAFVELAGARTALVVALRKEETLLGTITIFRQEVRPFSDKQIALLQNFAAQAVIAMENARLITETREALDQQTATAEVLGVINSSPGDLAPVFDAILEKAHGLCGADSGGLVLVEGNRYRAVAVHGEPSFAEYWLDLGWIPYPTGEDTLFGRLSRGEVVHLRDAAIDDGTRKSDQYHRLVELAGARSLVMVPLRKDDVLFGTITGFRNQVQPFSDKQIALLQNFAAQAVIAMENARLITETREALEQQTATAEVLGVINSSPGDLAPVFDAILEKAHSLCEADHGTLTVSEGEHFRAVAMQGMPEAFAAILRRPFYPTHGFQDRLLDGEGIVHISDITTLESSPDNPVHRAAIDLGKVRTLLIVALRKDGILLGYITANRQEVRPFTDKQIALLRNFAAQAVIAMENARLITETREALDQQTATAEILGVINSSSGDLAPVFDAMLQKAIRLCEATHGHFFNYDGECFHLGAFSDDARYVEFMQQVGAVRPGGNAPLGRIKRGERIVHIADMREEELYRTGPAFREQVELRGVRSQIILGLLKDNTLLGAMVLYRQEVRPFNDKQIALLQNFADQAVIAMENARLLGELRRRTDEVGELNRGLEARVAEQVDELSRVGRLKRFLAPQLAELIVSHGDEKILESHRREIVVVFCDLRGYTAFTETAEPEEVLDFLRQYHGALGPLVSQFEGTLDQFSGDGIMVFFNDPVPCADPAERAVNMAVAMRSAANTLIADWRERGRDLGFGAGIAQGYATLGQIGFSERSGYTAIGTVCNVAARLCAEAKDGQILLGQLVNVALKGSVATEQLGPLALKGLSQPVVAYNVPLGAIQPVLRVIEGGPQSV